MPHTTKLEWQQFTLTLHWCKWLHQVLTVEAQIFLSLILFPTLKPTLPPSEHNGQLTILCDHSTLCGHCRVLTEATHVFSEDPEVVLISYDEFSNGGTGSVVVLNYSEPFLQDTNTD